MTTAAPNLRDDEAPRRTALRALHNRITQPSIALAVGALAVVVCYFFVDRPVAWFFHTHRFYPLEFLQWPPAVSDWVTDGTILCMVGVVAWWVWRPGGELQRLLLAIAANLVVTVGIKTFLKGILGRSWPNDWARHKAEGRGPEVYGFHPFRFADGFHSFPSGHAATTFAIVSILWIARPKYRWLYAVIGMLMCLSLVVFNYHFVGDVIAGAMLGCCTGVVAARLFRVRPPPVEAPGPTP